MKLFYRFNSGDGSRQDIYLNFEMNANGAILAGYGKNKTERTPFEADMLQKLNCKAEVEEEQWNRKPDGSNRNIGMYIWRTISERGNKVQLQFL